MSYYKKQKKELDLLAEVSSCQVVVVEAQFDLKTLDGEDAIEPKDKKEELRQSLYEAFRGLLDD